MSREMGDGVIETATPGFEQTIEICSTRLEADDLVLDAPCGAGEALVRLAAARNVRGIGVDLDAIIQRAAAKGSEPIRFLRADGRALPFPDNQFDAVLCIGGPTCISPAIAEQRAPTRDELQANLVELVRVLRFGGQLVASDKCVPTRYAGPDVYDVTDWIHMIESAGTTVESFDALPVTAWDEYIQPRIERTRQRRIEADGDTDALAALDAYEEGLLAERPDGPFAHYGVFVARKDSRS